MKKIFLLIVLSSLILGCRSKKNTISSVNIKSAEIEKIKLDSIKRIQIRETSKKITDNTVKQKKELFSGDIFIKGKSDSLNPLEYYNIIAGDTLQSITIKGSADYVINNRYQKSNEKTSESKKEENSNIIQKTARDLVSKETIKDVAQTFESKTKDISVHGFQAGAWIVITIIAGFIILAFLTYKYFKK
ncbi:hypothetical protein [Chryseobacterium mucoviscidosis]|uniref:hypothetical protein n=1 Tax=Chryseobacterium mucoviscidosis TaxID=1945581 RepID=UPI003018F160